ncbi:MlaD family protein [Helicobacter sp. 23-1044]
MERGVNYIFIGACFMLSLVGFVVFIFWFSDSGIFKDSTKIYKSYTMQPLNIKVDSAVKYKGINVGRVSAVRFRDESFSEIEIIVEILKDLPVRVDSALKVEQSGILGASFLTLMQNEKSTKIAESGATLKISGDSLSQIMEAIPSITGKVDYLLNNANEVLSEDNAKNITAILLSINEATKNINILAQTLGKNTQDIDKIIANISKITDLLNAKITNGEYDLKTTIMPMLGAIESAMNDISAFAKNGNAFVERLDNDPYNTIFGYRKDEK